MTEIVQHHQQSDLAQQMDYARAVSTGNLLPQAYRGKPADILIAVGLGQAMGLSPAESLYRIDVIQGKPTASAELIAANVRKAGHKLRVRGDDNTCTATIVRADDPDFEFTITRDTAWANKMGLTTKDNYKKQPGTMLQWRAISAVARLACPEALYGVSYTPDEMTDMRPAAHQATKVSAADFTQPAPVQDEPVDAEIVHDAPAPATAGPGITAAQSRMIHASLNEHGMGQRDAGLAYITDVLDKPVESSKDLSKDEASKVIDALAKLTPAQDEPEPEWS